MVHHQEGKHSEELNNNGEMNVFACDLHFGKIFRKPDGRVMFITCPSLSTWVKNPGNE